MDQYNIDSHKLHYHVGRVNEWLEKGDVFPIYAEVGIAGACNHRCVFCAFDYMKYKPEFMDCAALLRFMRRARALGLRSVLFSGEGEPLLHPRAADIIEGTKRAGLDAALVSNGVLLGPELSERILGCLTWMKISVDAGSPETYARRRRTKKADFGAMMRNLEAAVKIRARRGLECTIGVQCLLLGNDEDEPLKLARRVRDIGVDYLVIKPYSQHPESINRLAPRMDAARLERLEKKIAEISGGDFQVIFRRRTIRNGAETKPYARCLGLPFAMLVSTDGEVYPCNVFVGKKDYSFGNIFRQDIGRIWDGAKRKTVMKKIARNWDLRLCRQSCRLDHINRYLWQLRNPGPHDSFI